MTRVKVCGITNRDDAMAAVMAGADALGLIFAESPRRVTPDQVSEITRDVPLFVTTIGVFIDGDLAQIRAISDACGLDAVQLHGSEDNAVIDALGPKHVIKGFRLSNASQIDAIRDCNAGVVLVEPYVEGVPGGTGRLLDENLASAALATGRLVMLAGGLTPENVRDIVLRLRPYAVDVGSGVEAEPGRKDHAKLSAFIAAVREADTAIRSGNAPA